MEDAFWTRWSEEYLTSLMKRTKWTVPESNIKINDLVIIKDADMPPGQWKRGRIIEVFPGQDGLIRSVKIRTMESEYERPITKVVVLPVDTSSLECLSQNNEEDA